MTLTLWGQFRLLNCCVAELDPSIQIHILDNGAERRNVDKIGCLRCALVVPRALRGSVRDGCVRVFSAREILDVKDRLGLHKGAIAAALLLLDALLVDGELNRALDAAEDLEGVLEPDADVVLVGYTGHVLHEGDAFVLIEGEYFACSVAGVAWCLALG